MTLEELLDDYRTLPEYLGLDLKGIEQVSHFGDRPIHVAATRGAIAELSILAAAGANLDAAGEHGYTALHCAVEQGAMDAVLWLLSHGADPSQRNMHEDSPQELARLLDEDDIANVLENFGKARDEGARNGIGPAGWTNSKR
ncbi:ankyrin repeat domain-containing protein [Roseateles chitinivorans]|uniref:ankyrin repeat domain-containing protein n=1 Tax=Roseateles chitinivorans TaxID=2917965 RepID=UPI003D6761D2